MGAPLPEMILITSEATTPPTFGAAGSSLGGGVGSSLVVPGDPPAAAELHVADLPLPKGLVAKGASKEGARLPEVALKLPARTAMRLIMELGAPPAEASGVVVPGSSALLSQLESKLHLLQVAHRDLELGDPRRAARALPRLRRSQLLRAESRGVDETHRQTCTRTGAG